VRDDDIVRLPAADVSDRMFAARPGHFAKQCVASTHLLQK